MRRKSERTGTKKAKASPEKKVEKVKRTRSRRKKQSTSSEESADEASPAPVETVAQPEEPKPPKTPVKEDSPEEGQDQVWTVKAPVDSKDVGEIQKLKICLTRPPSTPERAERSPRSKRKHSRATSSSDTTSVEAPEEKEKRKKRSKRSHRESKDEPEKNQDSQEEEMEAESASQSFTEDNTISTSNEDKSEVVTQAGESSAKEVSHEPEQEDKPRADTTVVSPKAESSGGQPVSASTASEQQQPTQSDHQETQGSQIESQGSQEVLSSKEKHDNSQNSQNDNQQTQSNDQSEETQKETQKKEGENEENKESQNQSQESKNENKESQQNDPESNHDNKMSEVTPKTQECKSQDRRRSMSADKSEILELHPEESKCESDIEIDKPNADATKEPVAQEDQVSKNEEKAPIVEKTDSTKDTNVPAVVASSNNEKRSRIMSTDSAKDHNKKVDDDQPKLQRSESVQSHDEPVQNGQTAPIIVSRKRRWGSRPSKITTQKSITISTDILKDIIPDVKPVEFDEVIEERKHKREVTEKIERPVLPKIVIDNTENMERNAERKEREEKDRDSVVKTRDLAANRKISIVKDNDSIITRPPSPPKHKQSCVLYITNLVRPFTLPQLKNLLQRTGRIAENGFWIDKIKSKCFVVYETEDQAVETRHALHGVTWPVSNPKTLQVDFSTKEAFEKTKTNEETEGAPVSAIPGTVEDWLREQDQKRERGEVEKPWERRSMREWDVGKNENDKEKENKRREERDRPLEKRRHRSPDPEPEPARKFKKKEEEAPAKLLDDLFKKTKATPCIYWLPLSAETIAIKEEQRRQHMAEYERRMQGQRRPHHRH